MNKPQQSEENPYIATELTDIAGSGNVTAEPNLGLDQKPFSLETAEEGEAISMRSTT